MKPEYRISFPQEPIRPILNRMKAAGMSYHRPYSPFPDPPGHGGYWEGRLDTKQLTTLDLPADAKVEQFRD